MRGIGLPELFVILALAIILVPIWIAIRAKLLGNHPYGWATYQAIELLIISFALAFSFISALVDHGFSLILPIYFLTIALCAFAAVEVFRRTKLGSVCLMASELLIVLLPSFIEEFDKSYKPIDSAEGSKPFVMLIVIFLNVFYFKKRWNDLKPLIRRNATVAEL
jgi:hypothetical protein